MAKELKTIDVSEYAAMVKWANDQLENYKSLIDDGEAVDINNPQTLETLKDLAKIAAENTSKGVLIKLGFEHQIEACRAMKKIWDERRSRFESGFESFKGMVGELVGEAVKGQKTKTIKGAYGSIGVSSRKRLFTAYGEIKADLTFSTIQKAEEKGIPREFLKPKVHYVIDDTKVRDALEKNGALSWVKEKEVVSARFSVDSNIQITVIPKQPAQLEASK